jgi:hypothetical protein
VLKLCLLGLKKEEKNSLKKEEEEEEDGLGFRV